MSGRLWSAQTSSKAKTKFAHSRWSSSISILAARCDTMQYLLMKLSVEDRVKNLLPAWLYYPYKIGREARAVEPELRILRKFVPVGCTAIDVGANRGSYSWALARGAG